ncbi:hypothetical protein [Stenotrophomonas sp. PFBMAA-4]|uniref:hypothetical protein n=1 Tax=Stenotrophomonas sp. PFBMAA-4 TaxID=3043301 RepID=UPI0024B53106|nr:hypothetical protein [Stenotrophomonas sp. PFBMAA-4]MDI9271788.1 hypothetical protein [Stenotrophomonas sp. PFBMAA-4]
MKFLGFPTDDHLWAVKWCDKHRQMHEKSRSSSVEILLQQIPARDAQMLRRMSESEVGQFLARDKNVAAQFRTALLDAGSLPAIRVGQVYQSGRRVGDLRTSTLMLDMPGGEQLMREISLGDNLVKPPGWAEKYNFRLLNPSQYELPYRTYDMSRCVVRRIEHGGAEVDVVIPRMLIEQTFYYPDSRMIHIAAKGDWDVQKDELLYLKPMTNGLETAICAETGAWKVVVRTHILDMHAPGLAIFAHSPYAQHSVNLIYSNALLERGSDRFAPWHASGRIPWDPELGPFRLRLRGLMLKSNRMKGTETFLVTHIAGWTLPAHVPTILAERENSGLKSQDGTEDPNRNRGGRSEGRGNNQRDIESGVDANPQFGNEGFDTTAIEWLEEPRVETQKKKSHISPTGEPTTGGSENPDQTQEASTGDDGGQEGNPGKATVRAITHPPSASFSRLLEALNKLKAEGFISAHSLFSPNDPAQREVRGVGDCWNFLSDEVANGENMSGKLPRRGWVILRPGEGRPLPRAALVVHIAMGSSDIYWVEIERRTAHDGMRSPILANIPASRAESIIGEMLLKIAESEGRGLPAIARRAVADQSSPANSAVFKHAYTYKKSPPMSPTEAKQADESAASDAAASQSAEGDSPVQKEQPPARIVEGLNIEAMKRVLRLAIGAPSTLKKEAAA